MKKDILYFFDNSRKKKKHSLVSILDDEKENIELKCDNEQKKQQFGERIHIPLDSATQALKQLNETCENSCAICNLHKTLHNGWEEVLKEEFTKNYYKGILSFLHKNTFFPQIHNVFKFSFYFPIDKTKVVILGQDPYHNENQAMGLSFSVPKTIRVPPSLRNIYKELQNDIKEFIIPKHGDLSNWASQGVLLLNDILTVEKNKPGSHSKIGWKNFTRRVLEEVNKKCSNVVFILWGNYARSKADYIDKKKHLILESSHPSPFSASKFFNCKHFSKTNEYLVKHNKAPIDWML